jgi:hypothetical protein
VVILATEGSLTLSGTIDVRGGNGTLSSSNVPGTGSGGGGLIHLLGPNALSATCGNCNVSAGLPVGVGNPSPTPYGGGASAGGGGAVGSGGVGASGQVIRSQVADPSVLFY